MRKSKELFTDIIQENRNHFEYWTRIRQIEAEEMEYNQYTKQYETNSKNTTD